MQFVWLMTATSVLEEVGEFDQQYEMEEKNSILARDRQLAWLLRR
jgi:hypothetical protein